jgi:pSer/pThr/pTyr-binding forkhead associated (FHA) protein
LNSRNGTFIDGVQIKSQKIRPGERIGFFDILVEVVKKSSKTESARPAEQNKKLRPVQNTHYQGNVAYDQFARPDHNPNQSPAAGPAPGGVADYITNYIDNVVLPGVYKLLEWFEFRMVIGFFVIGFVVLVTTLSAVPLTRILKASVEQEAQNRAVTIAKLLVRDNQLALAQGQTSLVTVENAMNEPGVSKAYVISSINRDILAPPAFAGQYLTDIPFVNEAAKTTQIQAKQIDDSTVVAIAPILYNNPNTGQLSALAHTVPLPWTINAHSVFLSKCSPLRFCLDLSFISFCTKLSNIRFVN